MTEEPVLAQEPSGDAATDDATPDDASHTATSHGATTDDGTAPSASVLLGRLRSSWDSSPALLAIAWGPSHLLAYQNAASARHLGERQLGVPLGVAFPELSSNPLTALESVRSTGEPVTVPRAEVGLLDLEGRSMVLHYVLAPIGATAPYDGVVMTAVDAAGEARAEQAAERANLLATITERMNCAPDPDAALQALTDSLVPSLADLAAVYVVADPAPAAGTVTAPTPPTPPTAATVSASLLTSVGPPPPPGPRNTPSPWQGALDAGQTVFIELGEGVDTSGVADSATKEWLATADAQNIVVVPLVATGKLTGALVLLSVTPRPPFGSTDTAFLEDVAARAGAAVAQVSSYQRQRQTALTLQRALLPSAPPSLPGMDVAARYVAGSTDVEVGGDWWDIHHLGDGRVGIGVGDVSGRGVPAAILMGQARAGMRVAAHADLSPVQLLTVLDAHVTDLVAPHHIDPDHRLPAKFATAAYAVIEPADRRLRVATAGHPPLLVRHPDGRVEQVQAPPGPPLGLGVGGYTEISVPFPPGALLVAFTDGLVESRTVDLDTGIAALVQCLEQADPAASIDDLADTLLALADGSDDTALIVLRLDG